MEENEASEEETEEENQEVEEKSEEPKEMKEEKEPEMKKPSVFSKIKRWDIYNWMIIVLIVLAIVGIYNFGYVNTVPQLVVSVIVAAVTDIVAKYVKTKQWKLSRTGIITGLFVGSILGEGTALQFVVLAAFLAEFLKHIIRYKGRNIFNPALLSLFILSLVLKIDTSWWASASLLAPQITSLGIPIVVLLGLFISWKYKRFSLTLPTLAVYFVIQFLLVGISNLSTDAIISVLFNNTLYYFVFLMLVEPKSSPVFRNSRIAYGITAAVLLSLLPLVTSFASLGSFGTIIAANVFLVTILLSNALGRVYERVLH